MTYCGGCGAVGAMPYRCAGCKHVHYCSHACQKDGWRTMHRYTCEMHQQRDAAAAKWNGMQNIGAKRGRSGSGLHGEGSERRKRRRLEEIVQENMEKATLNSLPPELLTYFVYGGLSGADLGALLSSLWLNADVVELLWKAMTVRDFIGPYRAEMAARKDDAEAPPELVGRPGWAPYERSTLFMTDELFSQLPLSAAAIADKEKLKLLDETWTWRDVYRNIISTIASKIATAIKRAAFDFDSKLLNESRAALKMFFMEEDNYEVELRLSDMPSVKINSPRWEKVVDRLTFFLPEADEPISYADINSYTKAFLKQSSGAPASSYQQKEAFIMPDKFAGEDLLAGQRRAYVESIRAKVLESTYASPADKAAQLEVYLRVLMWHVDPTLQVCIPAQPGYDLEYWQTSGIDYNAEEGLFGQKTFTIVYEHVRRDLSRFADKVDNKFNYMPRAMKEGARAINERDLQPPPDTSLNMGFVPASPEAYPVTFYDMCAGAYTDGVLRPRFVINDGPISSPWSTYKAQINQIFNLLEVRNPNPWQGSKISAKYEYVEWAAGPRVAGQLYDL
jgi:hypothetical protein